MSDEMDFVGRIEGHALCESLLQMVDGYVLCSVQCICKYLIESLGLAFGKVTV